MPCERLEVDDWFGETLFKVRLCMGRLLSSRSLPYQAARARPFRHQSIAHEAIGHDHYRVYPTRVILTFWVLTLLRPSPPTAQVNPAMVADYSDSGGETERRQRRQRVAQGEDLDPAKPSNNPENAAPHSVIGDLVNPIGAVRVGVARRLAAAGLRMPRSSQLAEESRKSQVPRMIIVVV